MKHIIYLSFGVFLSFSLFELLSVDGDIKMIPFYALPLIISFLFYYIQKKIKPLITLPLISLLFVLFRFIKLSRYEICFDNFSFTSAIYLILMIVFAITLYEVKQNETIGIRTIATLKYEEVWDKANKQGSYIFSLFIPLCFTTIFLYDGWFRFIMANVSILCPCVISAVVSHIISIPYIKEDYNRIQEELKLQQKIEEEGRLK